MPDSSLRRMALAAINLVGLRFGGAALGLLTQVLLARLLNPVDTGTVFLAMSATSILGLLATLGYPALTLTSTARYVALGRMRLLENFKRLLVHDTVVISLLLLAAVAAAVLFLPLDPAIRTALIFAALSLFAANLLRLNSALANSHRRFTLSYMPDFLFRPGLLCLFLVMAWLWRWPIGVATILWAFTAFNTLVALGQAAVMGKDGLRPQWHTPPARFAKPLRQRAAALVVVFAVATAFADLVTMIGGLYLPAEDVAVLAVAVRLAALAGFVTQALQQLVLPDLAQVLVRNSEVEFHRLALRVNLLSLGAIVVLIIAAIAFGPYVLRLFGPGYAGGQWPLVLFMVGQLLRAGSGLNQHLLSIGGFQTRTAGGCIAVVALLFAGASLLAPAYGVIGIAWAAVLADGVWAGLLAFQAKRLAGRRGDIAGLMLHRR
jgi:O-antigen/teichoic acid export membrane protein